MQTHSITGLVLTKRQGMIKMYNAEVLSKFPVVQHFNFGSLFSFERDPNAATVSATAHISNQPSSHTISVSGNTTGAPTSRPGQQEGTRAPWATDASASASPQAAIATSAPWAKPTSTAPPQTNSSVPTRAPWAASGPASAPAPGNAPTRAPWATGPR